MKRRILKLNQAVFYVAACVCLALLAGCRHADLNRELVERELRLQEDELYRAHDEIADRERRLETARRENAVLKRDLEAARSGAAVPPGIRPEMPPAPSGEPTRRTPRGDIPPADLTPPTIELPGAGGPANPATRIDFTTVVVAAVARRAARIVRGRLPPRIEATMQAMTAWRRSFSTTR